MTLIEVVMATGILGIVAGAIIGTFNYGFFVVQSVRENQRATQILMEKVETIRLYSWTQISPEMSPGFIPSYFSEVYDPQAAGEHGSGVRYNGLIRVDPVPFTTSSGYSTNMKQVSITLLWNSQGSTHVRRASTFVAKDGVQNYVY